MKQRLFLIALLVAMAGVTAAYAQSVEIEKDRFMDKCKGAWAGQMVGVCYADIYEFKSNGQPITEPLKDWAPQRVKGSLGQDDVYVEMTFLKALEQNGLDITHEQAGKAFAASEYELWHANKRGRENVRRGIMPPASGHPDNNPHANDIDFQIEADLLGIVCPGLPQESNRLGEIFGRIMNYGDGLYGGMFIAGMYAAAYFEDNDVQKVLQAGLDCIPAESSYHKCIADLVNWHKEKPQDWLAAWKTLEEKYQDDTDCMRGNPVNIDARLNGAYVAMGLLYGNGELLKTMEIATRCGQDTDCNSASAAGILCCMKGMSWMAPEYTSGIPAMADQKFSHTEYSFNTLVPACQAMAEQIIKRAGGEVTETAYRIPAQKPVAPPLEQWPGRNAEK